MNFHESKKQINKLDEIDLILQQDIFKQNVFAN